MALSWQKRQSRRSTPSPQGLAGRGAPSRKSRLEAAAESLLIEVAKKLGKPLVWQREFRFNPDRRWRADFYVHFDGDQLGGCLIEVEGLTRFGNHLGRHQDAVGFEKDCRKYLAAMLGGWTVFRFTENMLADGTFESALIEFFTGEQ